jgi:hypothetical protein
LEDGEIPKGEGRKVTRKGETTMSNQINPHVLAGTRLITDKLTMDELVATYMAAMQGFNPEPVMGYEKAKPLFTEVGGTRMHQTTLEALDIIIGERMNEGK